MNVLIVNGKNKREEPLEVCLDEFLRSSDTEGEIVEHLRSQVDKLRECVSRLLAHMTAKEQITEKELREITYLDSWFCTEVKFLKKGK